MHFGNKHFEVDDKPKDIPVSGFEKQWVLFQYDLSKNQVRKRLKDGDVKKLYELYENDCKTYLPKRTKEYLQKNNDDNES